MSNFFFPDREVGGGRRDALSTPPYPFNFTQPSLSLSLLIHSSMSHRQHLGKSPRARHLIRYIHNTIPSEREAGPAVNKLTWSLSPRPTTTTTQKEDTFKCNIIIPVFVLMLRLLVLSSGYCSLTI